MLDTREQLSSATANQTPQLAVTAAQVAGQMALRLVHDHLLRLDVQKYDNIIRSHVREINSKVKIVQEVSVPLGYISWIWIFLPKRVQEKLLHASSHFPALYRSDMKVSTKNPPKDKLNPLEILILSHCWRLWISHFVFCAIQLYQFI